jgi:filamentous hemagglutinin
VLGGSKYEIAKTLTGNLLGGGHEDESHRSTTHADIAEGTVEVRDGDDSTLAGLDRIAIDLNNANALRPIDTQKLQEVVEIEQALKGLTYELGVNYMTSSL